MFSWFKKLVGVSRTAIERANRVPVPVVSPEGAGGFKLPPRTDGRPDVFVAKYMTRGLNELCTEAGLQCTVLMNPDPTQYGGQTYHFKNLGKKLVHIYVSGVSRYLEPGEEVSINIPFVCFDVMPDISAVNYGNEEA